MTTCDTVHAWVGARERDEVAAGPLAEHLGACADCATLEADARAVLGAWSTKPDEVPDVWDGLAERIHAHHNPVKVSLCCSYCHDGLLRREAVYCAACLAPHHAECFNEHGSCSALGCGETRVVQAAESASRPRPARVRVWAALLVGCSTAALGGAAAWSVLDLGDEAATAASDLRAVAAEPSVASKDPSAATPQPFDSHDETVPQVPPPSESAFHSWVLSFPPHTPDPLVPSLRSGPLPHGIGPPAWANDGKGWRAIRVGRRHTLSLPSKPVDLPDTLETRVAAKIDGSEPLLCVADAELEVLEVPGGLNPFHRALATSFGPYEPRARLTRPQPDVLRLTSLLPAKQNDLSLAQQPPATRRYTVLGRGVEAPDALEALTHEFGYSLSVGPSVSGRTSFVFRDATPLDALYRLVGQLGDPDLALLRVEPGLLRLLALGLLDGEARQDEASASGPALRTFRRLVRRSLRENRGLILVDRLERIAPCAALVEATRDLLLKDGETSSIPSATHELPDSVELIAAHAALREVVANLPPDVPLLIIADQGFQGQVEPDAARGFWRQALPRVVAQVPGARLESLPRENFFRLHHPVADPGTEGRYTVLGRNVDVTEAALVLGRVLEVSMILPPEVKGRATVEYEDVDAIEALRRLVKTVGYRVIRENERMLRIVPIGGPSRR